VQRAVQAEPARLHDHQQVDRQQQAAAQVADGIPLRRHHVPLLLRHQIRQHRIVERIAAGKPDLPRDEQDGREQPVAFADQNKQGRRRDAEPGERPQELQLAAGQIGHRAEKRRQERHRHHRGRLGKTPVARRFVFRQPFGRHVKIKNRQHRRHHRRDKGRIGPVVHQPAPHRFPVHPTAPFRFRPQRFFSNRDAPLFHESRRKSFPHWFCYKNETLLLSFHNVDLL